MSSKNTMVNITLVATFIFYGCQRESKPPRPPGVFLEITQHAKTGRETLGITATLINNTDRAIAWDRDFCVFLQWKIQDQDGTNIRPEILDFLPRADPEEFGKRFVMVTAGEKRSMQIDLGRRFRGFVTGQTYEIGGGHATVVNEEILKYQVPKDISKVFVSLEYYITSFDRDGFKSWFGHECEELPFWEETVRSNPLVISFQ